MKIKMALFMGTLVLTLAVFTTGCIEELRDIAEGKIEIVGEVKSLSEPPAYTYNYGILTVINGPANVDGFYFELTSGEGSTILKGNPGHADFDGTIQFINNAGNEDEAETGDIFSLVLYQDCAGGTLKVTYNGNLVDTAPL